MEMTHSHANLAAPPVDLSVVAGAVQAAAAMSGAAVIRLADLATGTLARVVSVATDADDSAEMGRRLAELGFLPGEKLRIVARGFVGREPLAVRIGTGTFALRLFEAACIRVTPEQPLPR
jgi:ferrous iron transport protein A